MQHQDAPPVAGVTREGDFVLDEQPQIEEGASNKNHDNTIISDAPFSAFTKGEKWILVIMSSIAGFFRLVHPEPNSTRIY